MTITFDANAPQIRVIKNELALKANLQLFNEGSPNATNLEIIGYDEDPLDCPQCQARTNFSEVYIKGEIGGQIHSCLWCCHVFLASQID